MSRPAVGSALEAMQDDEMRDRFAAGDFSGIESELDDQERELVQRAAADYPEVLPFFTLLEHGSKGVNLVNELNIQLPAVQRSGGWTAAYTYALGQTNEFSG